MVSFAMGICLGYPSPPGGILGQAFYFVSVIGGCCLQNITNKGVTCKNILNKGAICVASGSVQKYEGILRARFVKRSINFCFGASFSSGRG
jgi:hypothetical protein